MTDIGTDRGGDGLCGRETGQEVLDAYTQTHTRNPLLRTHTKSVVTPT